MPVAPFPNQNQRGGRTTGRSSLPGASAPTNSVSSAHRAIGHTMRSNSEPTRAGLHRTPTRAELHRPLHARILHNGRKEAHISPHAHAHARARPPPPRRRPLSSLIIIILPLEGIGARDERAREISPEANPARRSSLGLLRHLRQPDLALAAFVRPRPRRRSPPDRALAALRPASSSPPLSTRPRPRRRSPPDLPLMEHLDQLVRDHLPPLGLRPRTPAPEVSQVVRMYLGFLRTGKLPKKIPKVITDEAGIKLKDILEALGIMVLIKYIQKVPQVVAEAAKNFMQGLKDFSRKVIQALKELSWKVLKEMAKFFALMAYEDVKTWFQRFSTAFALAICFGLFVYHYQTNYQALGLGQNFNGLLLLVGDDILEHDGSRRSLVRLSSTPGLQTVIPLCVLIGLEERMQGIGSDSFRALAAFHTVEDLLEFAGVRIQRSTGEGDWADCHIGYYQRMVNSALVLSHIRVRSTVVMFTNSPILIAKARERVIQTTSALFVCFISALFVCFSYVCMSG